MRVFIMKIISIIIFSILIITLLNAQTWRTSTYLGIGLNEDDRMDPIYRC